jgi:RHS repeat-associated protein
VTNIARPALAKSPRGWAILPNPFATARGRAARARWLTRYDGLDRLTNADNTSNVTQRAYPVDKTGNRTGKQTAANGAITPYVYAATNHRLAQTGTEARTYDAVGNPLTIGPRTLTYDDRSRLTVFVNGSTTRRYQYTGQGLRVRKWTSSNTSGNTYFVYNENAQLIGEYDNAGARVQEIVWLGNLPIGVIAGTAAVPVLHYIESDHLGTPRVIVEATRNVGIWRWNQTNDPFGESTPNQNPDGDTTSFTFNLRFAGQYRDSESGWYYNVHRYYDPTIGRYLESDPIGLNGGISTYSYVGAAPLTAVDPLGLAELGRVLGIHTDIHPTRLNGPAAGHAWISVNDDSGDLLETWSAFESGHELAIRDSECGCPGSDTTKNVEKKNRDRYRQRSSFFFRANEDQMKRFRSFAQQSWVWGTASTNCSGWVAEALDVTFGIEDAADDGFFGWERSPRSLTRSIQTWDANFPGNSVINPVSIR